ncbi:hypothetical protein LEMLEM_LOCUS4448 [Lemmus lemmus]
MGNGEAITQYTDRGELWVSAGPIWQHTVRQNQQATNVSGESARLLKDLLLTLSAKRNAMSHLPPAHRLLWLETHFLGNPL